MRNTAPVVDLLADAEGVGASTIRKLEANGIETVADLHAADGEFLTDIPYVSDLRADELQSLAAEAHTDPREVVLNAELGDRLSLDLWTTPRPVIATDETAEWHSAAGDTWQTRRIRIADSPTADGRTEYDLVAGAEGVYLTGGCYEAEPVTDAVFDGAVQNSTLVQLQVEQGKVDTESDRPEGDDTWRQYHQRGEA